MRGTAKRWRLLVALLVAAGLLTAACGDDGEAADEADEAGEDGGDDDADEPEGPHATEDPLEVVTDLGTVRGTGTAVEGVRGFLAMPYAAEPTGENRWRAPQPRDPYDGTFDATEPGGSCPQDPGDSTARFTIIPDPVDDCLTLSVWSPDDAEGLPVLVWFHGGGFTAGSAHQPYYQGDRLASQGAVVIGVNYRLGPLGFLATDELEAESEDGSFGNYGIADQTAALEWVQRNVSAFGGDATNVTIFGESAGGGSVCMHLASPQSEDLFHRAIIQSGGGCGRLGDPDDAKEAGADLMDALGCEDLACLRDLPWEEIQSAEGGFSAPIADGVRLSEPAVDLAEQGELGEVQVITGSNAQEWWLFALGAGIEEPNNDRLRDMFSEVTDDPGALLALYPAEDYETNLDRYVALQTDVRFTCPTLAFADAATENDVYVYLYNFADSALGLPPAHGIELLHLFGHPEGLPNQEPELSGADAALSTAMQEAWVAFATTGNPGEAWEPYGDAGQVTLLDEPLELTDQIRDGRCDDLDDLVDAGQGLL